jgi:sterol 24-C-methyltransferase
MAETLSKYRRSQERGKEEYARMVTAFDDLITDFFEYGWGQSFHFAPMNVGESFEESIAGYQHFLGEAIGLRPGMKVLDVGCGVGGPQRSLARKFGVSIVGLNINEYQLGKCSAYNSKAGLDHLCSILYGDFLNIPAEDGSFDAAYHIEAMCHAPDKAAAYAEIFRVLRPGAVFAGYDVCMTPLYDSGNPEHRELKEEIEYGNALPEIASFTEVTDSLRAVGFELVEAHDRALDADPQTPWYQPLESGSLNLRSFSRTALGRKIASVALHVLEGVRAVPKGSFEVQKILNIAADSLVAAGRLGIFTPMYYHKARKPG